MNSAYTDFFNNAYVNTPWDMYSVGNLTVTKTDKEGDEDMRYLYEVILVNPKNDIFHSKKVIAKSETSAIVQVFNESQFSIKNNVPFDDLKTSCKMLMSWKKKKSLTKVIENIKKAIE